MGGSECSGSPMFIFLLKKTGFASHHDLASCWAKQYIIDKKSSFLTLTSDSETILWLCNRIVCGLNWTRGQFKCDTTWFCFCFDFVRSHARRDCSYIAFLRFQVLQIKQVDRKMSTENGNNYK